MGSVKTNGDHSKKLNIIVVGGGIGGLGAAIALVLKGHHVTILEDKPALNEFGASIGILSNGTKVLKHYGLEEEFRRVVTKNDHVDMRDALTSERLGLFVHNAGNTSDINYGSETWNIHRADYQQTLADAALSRGAKIVFDADVVNVDVENEQPIVYCNDGRNFEADLVVGADGMRSKVRQSIPKLANIEPRKHGEQCWRATVPKDRMRGNPKIEWLLTSGSEYGFLADGRYILCWPLPDNRPFDVVCSQQLESDLPPGRWGIADDPKVIQERFSDFCPELVELLSKVDRSVKWTLAELPPLPTCRSDNGHVVLLGDAWHAMIPHSASGGNSAIEDGGVLGECIDWACKTGRSVGDATAAYEAIRKPRVERMQKASQEGSGFLNAGGEAQVASRHMMRAVTEALEKNLKRPEAERRNDPKPKADMNAVFPTLPYRQWLNGHDAIKEAQAWLAENMA